MAKINARGAREVARWEAFTADPDSPTFAVSTRWLVVLTSDGRVLRRLAEGSLSSGYSILATFKATDNKDRAGLNMTPAEVTEARIARTERFLAKRHARVARLARR